MITNIVFILLNIFCINKSLGSEQIKSTTVLDNGGDTTTSSSTTSSSTTINPDDYKPSKPNEDQDVIDMANKVIGVFQAVGSIVSVLALVLIGIKYMMGSIEEKAEYKKTMTNYIIGAVLVFGISNISAIIYKFARTLW